MQKIKLLELEYRDINPDTIQLAWRAYVKPYMDSLGDKTPHEVKALIMQKLLYKWLGLLQGGKIELPKFEEEWKGKKGTLIFNYKYEEE